MLRRRTLASLAVIALVAAPVGLAGRFGGSPSASPVLDWHGKRVAGSWTLPASGPRSHVVAAADVAGDGGLAHRLRLVVYRGSDGARLFDGSVVSFAGLDLGSVPAAAAARQLRYVLDGPHAAAGSLRVQLRWQLVRG